MSRTVREEAQVATLRLANKMIEEQSRTIAELRIKLAEKERQLIEAVQRFNDLCGEMNPTEGPLP